MHRDNKNGDAFFEKNQIYSNLALSYVMLQSIDLAMSGKLVVKTEESH